MKKIETFENKKVLVLGLAKSGEAAARLLEKLGAIVTVNDGKPFDENPAAQSLLEEGIKVVCGSHPLELLDENFELMVKNPGIRYDNPMVARAIEKNIPVITEVELAYMISDAPITVVNQVFFQEILAFLPQKLLKPQLIKTHWLWNCHHSN